MANPNQPGHTGPVPGPSSANPGQNAGTPGGPTQPNPPGNIQGAAQRTAAASASNQAQPGSTVSNPQVQGDPNSEVVDVEFNGKSVTKIRVPKGTNLRDLYSQFEKEHDHVSDKKGAFPTSFVGDLVNKHGAEQVDVNQVQADRVEKFRIV